MELIWPGVGKEEGDCALEELDRRERNLQGGVDPDVA